MQVLLEKLENFNKNVQWYEISSLKEQKEKNREDLRAQILKIDQEIDHIHKRMQLYNVPLVYGKPKSNDFDSKSYDQDKQRLLEAFTQSLNDHLLCLKKGDKVWIKSKDNTCFTYRKKIIQDIKFETSSTDITVSYYDEKGKMIQYSLELYNLTKYYCGLLPLETLEFKDPVKVYNLIKPFHSIPLVFVYSENDEDKSFEIIQK